MSVIFKTLNKLKTESTEKENSNKKLVRKKRIYFFQNALCSPSYVFLLLLVFIVVGAGTLKFNPKFFLIPTITNL